MLGQAIRGGLPASFDGEAELETGDQALQLLLVPPLAGTDEALYRHAHRVGQRQQNTSVGFLNTEIDVVVWLKHITDFLEWTVHAGS